MADKNDDLWQETGDDPVQTEDKKPGQEDWTGAIGNAIANHLEFMDEQGWLKETERLSLEGENRKGSLREARMLAGLSGLRGQAVVDHLVYQELGQHGNPEEDRWILELPPEED